MVDNFFILHFSYTLAKTKDFKTKTLYCKVNTYLLKSTVFEPIAEKSKNICHSFASVNSVTLPRIQNNSVSTGKRNVHISQGRNVFITQGKKIRKMERFTETHFYLLKNDEVDFIIKIV